MGPEPAFSIVTVVCPSCAATRELRADPVHGRAQSRVRCPAHHTRERAGDAAGSPPRGGRADRARPERGDGPVRAGARRGSWRTIAALRRPSCPRGGSSIAAHQRPAASQAQDRAVDIPIKRYMNDRLGAWATKSRPHTQGPLAWAYHLDPEADGKRCALWLSTIDGAERSGSAEKTC